jgi:hypothetical protein
MIDDFEDPPNDIPDEPPPGVPAELVPDPAFPDDDAIDGSEDDATTTPEDPQT